MKKFIFLAALLSLALYAISCGDKNAPEPEKQYSTWIVNGTDTFSTNEDIYFSVDCNPDHSYCRSILATHGSNRFTLAFALDYFPTEGVFELDTNNLISPGILLFNVLFYYQNRFYYHSPSRIDTVFASTANNKVRYTMPACWFVNYDNPTGDSMLIEGVFNEP